MRRLIYSVTFGKPAPVTYICNKEASELRPIGGEQVGHVNSGGDTQGRLDTMKVNPTLLSHRK